jgi:hypothetical protein
MGTLRFEFKPDDGIYARRPMGGAPRLHNEVARNQFDIPSHDHSPEHRKGVSFLAADLGCLAGKGGELLGIRCGLAGRSTSWCREVRVASDPADGCSALAGADCARIFEPAAQLPNTLATQAINWRRVSRISFIMSLRIVISPWETLLQLLAFSLQPSAGRVPTDIYRYLPLPTVSQPHSFIIHWARLWFNALFSLTTESDKTEDTGTCQPIMRQC